MVKVAIDFSVFAGPNSDAWGMVNGTLDLPIMPAVGDKLAIMPDSYVVAALEFPAALRVESVIKMRDRRPDWDSPVDTILMFEDVVFDTAEAAEQVAAYLGEHLGLTVERWSDQP